MEVKSVADLIIENRDFWKAMVKAGIIDPCWNARLEVYQEFKTLPEDMPVMHRYYEIANKRNVSLSYVRKSVSFFVG